MFTKFRLLVFVISLLGFSLSSCQKDELYTPEGPGTTINAGTGYDDGIVDPDGDDDEEEDSQGKGDLN